MHALYQDSMAIASYFRTPSLFITFTANPGWEEITRDLLPGQKPEDRPDLVARVFELKKKEFLRELINDKLLGVVITRVWTIEYQKRGLPYMYIVLFMDDREMYTDPVVID